MTKASTTKEKPTAPAVKMARRQLGICPACHGNVGFGHLYVTLDGIVFHESCRPNKPPPTCWCGGEIGRTETEHQECFNRRASVFIFTRALAGIYSPRPAAKFPNRVPPGADDHSGVHGIGHDAAPDGLHQHDRRKRHRPESHRQHGDEGRVAMAETLEEALNRTAEEAWEERAEKQRLLVNRTFRIDSLELVQYTNQNGHEDESHVATLLLDGETETRNFWLGGALVRPQLDMMVKGDLLPAYVTLIEDGEKKGNPYRLLVPSTGSPEASPPPASGHPHLDALVQFCRSNGLVWESGKINAAAVLTTLDVQLSQNKEPAETFKVYCEGVGTTAKVKGDDVYRIVLEELVAKMGLTQEPEDLVAAGEIPFE